jgi:signal transduction histidine kinase
MTGRPLSFGAVLVAAVVLATTAPSAGAGQPAALMLAMSMLALAAARAWLGGPASCVLLAGAAAALGTCAGGIPGFGGEAAGSSVAIAAAVPVLTLAGATLVEGGRLRAVVLTGGLVAGPVRAAFYDPFLDQACAYCRPSAIVLHPAPSLASALLVGGCALAAAGLLVAFRRGAPRVATLVVVVALLAVAIDCRAGDAIVIGALAVTLELGLTVARGVRARARLRELTGALADAAGLEHALREASGDSALRVDYRLEGEDRWATADGGPAPPPGDRSVVVLRFGGAAVARVVHDARGAVVDGLVDRLDLATWVGLENARLGVILAARVEELSASRARIVARADAERLAIERDVHDGAQQQVLALGFGLRVALADAPPDERSVLEASLEEARLALDDLRELSHGLYPPILASGGLAPAVGALARRSDVPIALGPIVTARLDPVVERVIYALVDAAAEAGGEGLAVAVEAGSSQVRVVIAGVAAVAPGVLTDRVAAVGGTLEVAVGRMEAVIPCA